MTVWVADHIGLPELFLQFSDVDIDVDSSMLTVFAQINDLKCMSKPIVISPKISMINLSLRIELMGKSLNAMRKWSIQIVSFLSLLFVIFVFYTKHGKLLL